jgi:hypothetical protein
MLINSPLVGAGSGSLGGLTMSHNRGGQYLRKRVVPTNPGTSRQQVVRSLLGTLASRWGNVLTAAQRDAWDLYGSSVAFINAIGETIFLTGQQQYLRSNVPRLQASMAVVDDGPTDFTLPTLTPPTISDVDAGVQEIEVAFNDGDAWASEDGAGLIFLQGKPLSAGRSFFKGPYRFALNILGDSVAPPTSPQSITALPYAVASGQLQWLQARVSRADGRLSLPIRIGPEVAHT